MMAAGKYRVIDWLSRFVIAWFLASSLSHLFLQTAAPAGISIWRITWVCAASLLIGSLLLGNRWRVLATLSLMTLALFVLRADIQAALPAWIHFFAWAGLRVTGWQAMNPVYQPAFVVMICALMSLGAWLACLRFRLPLLAIAGTIAVAGYGIYFESPRVLPHLVLPLTACLLAIVQTQGSKRRYARQPTYPWPRTFLALMLTPLLLAMSLVPLWLLPQDTSALRADAITTRVDGWLGQIATHFSFTRSELGFSIAPYGYYPDQHRLGGSVTPSAEPILAVIAAAPTRLRGSVFETYTGSQWLPTAKSPLHRLYEGFVDEISPEQIRSFDLDLPDRSIWDDEDFATMFYTSQDYDIHMLAHSDRTLFVPGRLLALRSGDKLRPTYNLQGEVQARRALRPGDTYSFSSYVLPPTYSFLLEKAVRLVDAAERSNDPAVDEAYLQACLQLPETLPLDVYMTAFHITRNRYDPSLPSDAYEVATLIAAFLRQDHFSYSLMVEEVPAGRDFVEWFFATGVGYCTYFASAATILARCAGIPARYVEGFLLPSNGAIQADGRFEYIVTGKQAHAWCEVYIRGVGWIALDPSPGFERAPVNIAPVPSPTISTPLPTSTPTMPPADLSPTHAATEPDWTPGGITSRLQLAFYWMIPAVLASVALALWYRQQARRYLLISLQKTGFEHPVILAWYWRSAVKILTRTGFASCAEDTPFRYLERLGESTHPAADPHLLAALRWLAQTYVAAIFGAQTPSTADLARAQATLQKVLDLYKKMHGSWRYIFLDIPLGHLWPDKQ